MKVGGKGGKDGEGCGGGVKEQKGEKGAKVILD